MDNLEKIKRIKYFITLLLVKISNDIDLKQNKSHHPIWLIEKMSENLFDLHKEFNHEGIINYENIFEILKNSLSNYLLILEFIEDELEEDLEESDNSKGKNEKNNIISIV